MLSKPLIFYARILTTLFVLIIYFPKAAPAQQLDVPKLIDLSILNDRNNQVGGICRLRQSTQQKFGWYNR